MSNQTIAPNLIEISNFRSGTPTDDGNPRTFVDYTFDRPAELSGGDATNFNLVPTDGGSVLNAKELIEGENTRTYTIAYLGAIAETDIGRGYIDSGTVRIAGNKTTNPLQSADVSNSGNTTDPDLKSVVPNFPTNELIYTFDQTVNIDDDAGFGFYNRQGKEFDGAIARQLNPTTVAVEFVDVRVASAVGATVDNGAVADLEDDSNQPDEVLTKTRNSISVVFQPGSVAIASGTENNDILLGTEEAETIRGLGGDDVLIGRVEGDTLDGGEGKDTIIYQLENSPLTADIANNAVSSQNGENTLVAIENIVGSNFGDRIKGNNQSNYLAGGKGNDAIDGSGGDDFIVGGAGSDTLTGAGGANNFAYLSLESGADTITDFSSKSDLISISSTSFDGDIDIGSLSMSRFTIGSTATNNQQRFIYDNNTGQLFYDSDGSGQSERQLLATLDNNPDFSADDIVII